MTDKEDNFIDARRAYEMTTEVLSQTAIKFWKDKVQKEIIKEAKVGNMYKELEVPSHFVHELVDFAESLDYNTQITTSGNDKTKVLIEWNLDIYTNSESYSGN